MAMMARLASQVGGLVEETYRRKNDAEENREAEYLASVRIQAWFRATVTRTYLQHLNNCATKIQRTWRGFLGRRRYRANVKNSVFAMKLNHYNTMSTKIQKCWRGYYTRKYIFNYYSRKRYLEALQIKNQIVRNELEEFKEQQDQIRRRQQEHSDQKKREAQARKTHYLVSTTVVPGIYNSPFRPFPMDMEYLLNSVKPLPHKKQKPDEHPYDPTWKSYDLPCPEPLPPVSQKPQGPFRDLHTVQKQRYKPFQPSLRVATSFSSLEDARKAMKDKEWVERFNDKMFQPFSKHDHQYEPLLYTTSKYGHLSYGNKYFREEQIDKHILAQNFKTVVPPIPILEKLNDTYSQGQV